MKYWLCRKWRNITYLLTPRFIRKKDHKLSWASTLLKDIYRVEYFKEKGWDWEEEFEKYWANRKTKTEAAYRIGAWLFNDMLDTIIVGQLNDDNLLRNLFRKMPTVPVPSFSARSQEDNK